MTPLRQQMIAAFQLSGKGKRTQQAYVREVRLLAQFYGKSPHLLSEQELQHSFLHRQNVDGLAPASMRLCYSGIRFFYQHVLQRDGHTLSLIRAQPTHRLPAVPRVEEVRRLLKAAPPRHHQVYFTTVCSLGLRLHEALYLQVSDIDAQRLQVHVHRGKGAKECYVPLPEETLALLRTLLENPSQQDLPLSRHRAGSKTKPYGNLSHESRQRSGCLPQSQRASRDQQHWRGHP